MRLGGIDPGKAGGLAVIDTGEATLLLEPTVEFFDAPVKIEEMTHKSRGGKKRNKKFYDLPAMAKLLRDAHLDFVTIEKTWAVPSTRRNEEGESMGYSQGEQQVFASGEGYGLWRGMMTMAEIRFQEIAPQRWQHLLIQDPPKDSKERKKASVPAAIALYPSAAPFLKTKRGKLLVDRADALLLAHYGRVSGLIGA